MRTSDPLLTFAEVVKRIRVAYPEFSYIHFLEPTTHLRPDGEGGHTKAEWEQFEQATGATETILLKFC